MKFRNDIVLITILIFGFVLGIGNPWFDYPMAFSVGDEFESQKVAIQIMAEKSLRQYSTYLPLWSWIQIPFIALVIGFQFLLGEFKSISQLQSTFILQAPGMYLWVARILSAMISALGIIWVYGIGRELKNRSLGLLMASLYMLDFMRVQTAHFGRHTSIYQFFSLGFAYFFIKFIKSKERKYLPISFIFATLATASYQMGAVYFLVLIIGFSLCLKKWDWLKDGKTILTIIASLSFLGFLIWLNPGMLDFTINQLKPLPQSETLLTKLNFGQRFWFYLKTLGLYQGMILIVAISGIVYGLIKKQKLWSYQLAFIFACIIPFAPYLVKNSTEPRYLLPLTLMLIWLTGMVLEKIYLKYKFYYLILLVLIISYSGLLAFRFNYLMFKPSTYLQAKQWLENSVDLMQKLLINGNNYYLIPSLSSQQPGEIYDLDYYHKINKELIKISDEKQKEYANIKNVRPANNLTYLSGGKDYQFLFQARDYSWIVLDYYSQSEKDKLKKWFAMEENWQPTISFNPRNDGKEVDTTLNVKNPWNLFKLNNFGPYIEIYRNPNDFTSSQ